MNDRELRKEFIRIEKTPNEVQIFVREIRWEGPHTRFHLGDWQQPSSYGVRSRR